MMPSKFWKKTQKGLTIIELLIAVSLFTTISLLALNIFVNITKMQGRIALENAIYEDARFMMERMTRAIRNNTIDYEEYFNKAIDANNQFGDLQGCYAAQFYNPGEGVSVGPFPNIVHLGDKPGELGALCNDDTDYNGQDCVVYKPSVDLNTGNFPYLGYSTVANFKPNTDKSNAFCPLIYGVKGCDGTEESYNLDRLYLIDKDGRSKTIFAQKEIKDLGGGVIESALAMIKLNGQDSNNDGVFEKWRNCAGNNTFCCAPGFICDGNNLDSLEETLNKIQADSYLGFVPISPLRSNISNLKFTISPVEDARKAFAEGMDIVAQPKVTITLSVKPTQDQLNKYGNPDPNNVPAITLQTTISSRIQSEVKSYLGNDTYKIGIGLNPAPSSAAFGSNGYCPLAN